VQLPSHALPSVGQEQKTVQGIVPSNRACSALLLKELPRRLEHPMRARCCNATIIRGGLMLLVPFPSSLSSIPLADGSLG